MHQENLSHLKGTLTPWSKPVGVSGMPSMGPIQPERTAPLWARLLLVVLLVPGTWSLLTDQQEEMLVELHNYYRGQVSPSAAAMLPLKWDRSLKLIAEGYAAKCMWKHNNELEDTGENLFAGTGKLDLREALEKWFLERLDYTYENNSCADDKMCGHYTQMVWADTHRIGCAVHFCNTIENLDWNNVSFLVCNYFPAGNYDDERPFVEGDWCSRCPEDFDSCPNHLCAKKQDENTDEEEMTTDSPLKPDISTAASNPSSVHDSSADVTPTILEKESDETVSPWSAMETVSSPELQPTPLGEEEEDSDPNSKPNNLDEEKQRKESVHRQEEMQKILEPARTSAASVLAASFLLACLTGLLTLAL